MHFLGNAGGSFAYDPWDGYALAVGGGDPPTFGETGTWALSGVNWTNLSVPSGPPPRLFAAMTWDYADTCMVLFGGAWITTTTGFSLYSDTWTFRSGAWQELATSVEPSARYGAAMAYDPATGSVILFGGSYGTGALNDTWSFKSGVWTNVTTSGAAPSGRFLPGMAWDSGSGGLILFGGGSPTPSGNLTEWNDTWSYSAGNWSLVHPPSGTPSPRLGDLLANDTAQSYLLLAGGESNNSALNDTWTFSSGRWSHLSGVAAPPGVYGVATYDSAHGRVLVKTDSATLSAPVLLGDGTWWFDGASWRLLVRFGLPGPLLAPSFASDPVLNGVVLFGGGNASGGVQDSTWLYRSGVWWEIGSHDGPAAREGASMAFDEQLGGLVLFGGASTSTIYNDTWLYRDGEWRELAEPVAPPPAVYVALAFDSTTGDLIAFGGNNNTTAFGSTWILNGSGIWAKSGSSGPPARTASGLAADPSGNGLVLFGGSAESSVNGSSPYLADTWIWTNSTWTVVPMTAPPPGRAGLGFAYNPHIGADVLFGGSNATTFFSDTWEFARGNWSNVSGGPSPGALTDAPLAFDPAAGTVVEFGGIGIQANPPALLLYGTTWEFDQLEAIASSSADSGVAPTSIHFNGSALGGVAPLTPFWQFADGGSTSAWNVTHAYYQPYDEYKATFTVTDGYGVSVSLGFTENISGTGVTPLSANASASATIGNAPFTVNFTGFPAGGIAPYTFGWAFGDGTVASTENASHTYTVVGTFTAQFGVTDSLGGTAAANLLIEVRPQVVAPLTVELVASPANGTAPLAVNFTVSVSGGVAPYAAAWTYGDGVSGAGETVQHTFETAGNFSVAVEVTDNASTQRWAFTTIEVTKAPPANGTPGGTGPSGSSGPAIPIWAIFVVVIASVALASAAVAFWRRRRPRSVRPPEPPSPPDEGREPDSPS